MREKKTVVNLLMLSLLLLTFIPSFVLGSSEDWVEVVRFTGEGLLMGSTEAFVITHVDWRIRYNYSYQLEDGNIPLDFSVVTHENYVVDGKTRYFTEPLVSFNPEEKNGTYYLENCTGIFHLYSSPTPLVNYSFIIEQNVESAKNFPEEAYSKFEERRFQVHDTHDFYYVTVVSNSSVSDFYFFYDLMRISFYVNGTAGTSGLCNVSIPSEFMSTEFSVFKDEKPLIKNTDYTETFNGTHYLFTITYQHSNHLIEIFANNNIPEFPSWIVFPFFVLTTIAVIICRNKLDKNKK